jgi:hypothetical protein
MLFPGSTTISRPAINHPALSHSQIKLSDDVTMDDVANGIFRWNDEFDSTSYSEG